MCHGLAFRRINALDLHGFHLHTATILNGDLCPRIHDAAAAASSLPVVLFYILKLRIFANEETVETIMA